MRVLHTMIRVVDLERSINFYTQVLKMAILKHKDYLDGKFTLVFVGYPEVENGALIELTHNWETKHYQLGNGFGHVAIEVEDIFEVCENAKLWGANVTRAPAPMKFGGEHNIAFLVDPDGYQIELIEKNKIEK
ncbi:MAG: lactoylglutathione lyase [Bacteroidia bacterium]|nr:MAG: lactoylglutathione lyase [Bacteroidia bacterium]